jgi:16S rRNA (guanine966-N2)-methyltransferase
MRILAGKYKGVSIDTQTNSNFRPTKSIIRKSIYDRIGSLDGQNVLDLFAGSGILGFEAASRGAQSVTFVEVDNKAIVQLKKNISKLKGTNFIVIKMDVYKFLKSCDSYNLILSDPPYGKSDLNSLADLCYSKLRNHGIFILESAVNDPVKKSDIEKRFGQTKISIWRKP